MSKTELTPWQRFFDKEYLGSHNFDDGEQKTVTIKSASKKAVTKPGGKKDDCLVIEFDQIEGEEPIKPMVVNVTNSKAIQKVSGSRFIENWAGTKITLYVDHSVKFAGKTVDGIRVKVDGMKAQKDHLSSEHPKWKDCVSAVAKGYTVADIRKKYNVTAEVGERLVKAATAAELAQ
jgi:hypothetical protein